MKKTATPDNLTLARRWLNESGQLDSELSPTERARRVAAYAAQVATYGRIVAFLPVNPAGVVDRRLSRFAHAGDALGKHRMVG